MRVKKVNAFTDSLDGGNPAGVALNPPSLTEEQMKLVSQLLNVSETAFLFPSEKADYRLRFFSPEVEVALCGHATIATFFSLAQGGKISKEKKVVTQETNIGVLPVKILRNKKGEVERVTMTQGKPSFKNIDFNWKDVADALCTPVENIDTSLPKQVVSTGLFTLPVCIKSFEALKSLKPDFNKIKKLCHKLQAGSFHVFTFETIDESSVYHARNFAPLYGVNEDPVTGTANGAVCSYLIRNGIIDDNKLICEQGDIIGRAGRVFVEIENDTVMVGGKAKIVEEKDIEV
ncbi:MAG: PhzF family phenazine biosynthesis protein [Thermoplasmata archaeon]|nr:PhzF family phenazine biosynthesis protein [Thermoplasmata archaeon]